MKSLLPLKKEAAFRTYTKCPLVFYYSSDKTKATHEFALDGHEW